MRSPISLSISASAAASAAAADADAAVELGFGGVRGREVVDELRLLLEGLELAVVEGIPFGGDRVELVHQGLGLARRDDRLQLGLQPLALLRQLGTVSLGRLDRFVELALAGDDRGDRLPVAAGFGRRRRNGRSLRQIGPPMGELVDGRVCSLQLAQVVGQHGRTA